MMIGQLVSGENRSDQSLKHLATMLKSSTVTSSINLSSLSFSMRTQNKLRAHVN